MVNVTKGNMMIRQLMFFGRKNFGLPLFFSAVSFTFNRFRAAAARYPTIAALCNIN